MSIAVRLDDLAQALGDHGWAYLVTVGDDGRAHVVAATPALVDGALVVRQPGRRTRANVSARPAVTLAFPPAEPDGYTLIVDGEAAAPDDESLAVRPTSAVLHRPAAPGSAPGPTGCGSDCHPVDV